LLNWFFFDSGDAYGYLKLFPIVAPDGTITTLLNPLDIAVFDQLPLDLGVCLLSLMSVSEAVMLF
jgi:hypothetical protein